MSLNISVLTFGRVISIILVLVCLSATSCIDPEKSQKQSAVIVFKHGKIPGDQEQFTLLLKRFEKETGITVKDEILPASTDEQHQFYVINLEGKSADFDVMSLDVIWVPEFARAGWLRSLTKLLSTDEMRDFFPGPLKAVMFQGEIYAIPWYIDAGVLYYRRDLLMKYGFPPPKTWDELIAAARYVTPRESDLYGFIWQGKQYEGLVCNALEYFWGNGGDVLHGTEVVIDSSENREALGLMRDLIVRYQVTPSLVTTAMEEPTRHIFGNGNALFMRNWPYAWNILENEGSPVRGKVGVTSLPSFRGGIPASTLGGWQLGVNRFSRNPEESEKLVRFLTSMEVQKALARSIGYKPPRKSLYKDKDLLKEQPFITGLYDIFMNAKPRPVSPYYMMITQVMQPEFSAVLAGLKPPEEALGSAQKQIEYILRSEGQ